MSRFEKDCVINLNKFIRTNVHLHSLLLLEIWLDYHDKGRGEYADEYYDS